MKQKSERKIMLPSELVQKLVKDMTSWLNSPKHEGIIMNEITLNIFILHWLLDNDVTVSYSPPLKVSTCQ